MSLHDVGSAPHRLPPGMIDVRTSATPNAPWFCAAGTFAGKHLVVELGEEQGAVMGRKYSVESAPTDGETRNKKDGRPINPHPIVRVRVFTCGPNGEGRVEVDPSVIEASGIMMICNVTLYPYNLEYDEGQLHPQPQQGMPVMPSPILSGKFSDRLATENTYPPEGMARLPQRELSDEQAVYRHLTHGARDVQHVIVPELHIPGRKAIYFVFKDLMIAEIGHFVLKYKLMFIDPEFFMNGIRPPALSTCWGRVFAIYPSKKAPNLKRSTPLEWHLHRNGGHISHPRNVSPESRGSARQPAQQRSRGSAGRGRGAATHAAAPPNLQPTPALRAQDDAPSDEDDEDDDMSGAAAYQDFLRSTSGGTSRSPSSLATPRVPSATAALLSSQQHHQLPPFSASSPHSPVGSASGCSAASLPPSSPGSQSPSDRSIAGSPHPPSAATWGSPPAPFTLTAAAMANTSAAGAGVGFGSTAIVPGQATRRARYDPTRDRWV